MPLVFIFLILSVLLSCSSQPVRTTLPLQQKLVKLREQAEQKRLLAGDGQIRWKDQKDNVRAGGLLFIKYPDRLRLEVQDPFGGTQAVLIMNGPDFFWYDARNERAWRGKVKDKRVQRFLTFPFISEDFVQAMLGQLPIPNDAKQDIDFRLHWAEQAETFQADINEEYWHLAFFERATSKQTIRVEYRSFERIDAVGVVPMFTRVQLFQRDKEQARLDWRWSEVSSKISQPAELFTVPRGTYNGIRIKTL